MNPPDLNSSRTGLILTGGGARAAYQVGVLKAIAEMLPRGSPCPFPVITGTSAGAVSAIVLASKAAHFRRSVLEIDSVWRNFRVNQVFKADAASMVRAGLHWMLALLTGGWLVPPPHAMFDNSPLWDLLRRHLDFDGIPRGLYRGHLRAISVCATSYSDAESVAFYHAVAGVEPWQRTSRSGMRVQMNLDHLMASLAIPFLFRPVQIGGRYYGDGAMRQTAPLSAALHLGADRLLIIGVRDPKPTGSDPKLTGVEPSFGHMFGFMLDTLFMDQIVADLERLNSINESVPAPGVTVPGGVPFRGPNGIERRNRRIESIIITPSKDIAEIARRHRRQLPFTLRTLVRTLGVHDAGGQQLISYLLFDRAFTRELIDLGYADGRARSDELVAFLRVGSVRRMRVRS